MRKVLDFLSLGLLRRIGIRYRLVNAFLLISIFPVLIAGVIAYRESSRASQEKVRIFASEIVKQVAQNVLQQIEKIETSSETLVLSDRIQSGLRNYYSDDASARTKARADMMRLLLDNYGSSPYINQKYVLDRNAEMTDAQVFAQLGQSVSSYVKNIYGRDSRPYWGIYHLSAEQNSVVMLREIVFKDNNRRAGTLFIGLKTDYFSRTLAAVDLGYDSHIYIINRLNGQIIVSGNRRDENNAHPDIDASAFMKEIADIDTSDDHISTKFLTYFDGKKSKELTAVATIPHTNWVVVSTTPLDALNAEVHSIRNKIILIGLLCLIVALLLSYFITRSIALPLRQLISVMQQTKTGNYQIRMSDHGSDEISVLSQHFNEMANKVSLHNEALEELVAGRTQELKQANAQLAALSITDGLTGIANRRRFDEMLSIEFNRAMRTKEPLALLMLDVDYFKNYNDHYGHLAGDDCLRKVTQIMRECLMRSTDLIARYGGEEFAVIISDSDSALVQAETIRNALQLLQLPHAGSPLAYVTCSIGVAIIEPEAGMHGEILLRLADAAMYHAKSQGRNRVVLNGSSVTDENYKKKDRPVSIVTP